MLKCEQYFMIDSFVIDKINVYRQMFLTIESKSTIHEQRNLNIIVKKSASQKRLYFLVTKHKMIFNCIKRRKFYICIQASKSSLKFDV
jgi:hypothetical protein